MAKMKKMLYSESFSIVWIFFSCILSLCSLQPYYIVLTLVVAIFLGIAIKTKKRVTWHLFVLSSVAAMIYAVYLGFTVDDEDAVFGAGLSVCTYIGALWIFFKEDVRLEYRVYL